MNRVSKYNLTLFFYMLVSTMFFVASLKFSGTEAYLYTGILAYLKWSIISLILNVGFIFQYFKPKGWIKAFTIPLMFFATFVNWLIYANPKNFIIYDILSAVLILMSLFLIAKGFFGDDKNLYA